MNRNYNMPDTDMFSVGRTHRALFITYKTEFTTFNPFFNDPYDAQWLASIEVSEAWETAETRDDQLQQETSEVLDVMANARGCYNGMKYFIEFAFATKPDIRNKFGLDDYDDVSVSQKKMRTFLENMYVQSNVPTNLAALNLANCTAMRIAEIRAIALTLSTEDTEQNAFVLTEPVATKGRINQYNSSFNFDQQINRASKVVFYNMPEELNLFMFPRNTEPVDSFNVLGTARTMANVGISAVQVRLLSGAAAPAIAVTTTDINGEFGFGGIAAGNYMLEFSKAGFMTQNIPVAVAPSGQVTVNATLS